MNTYKKIALLAAAVLLLAAMMTVMIGCGKTPAGGTTPTGQATGTTGEQTVDPTNTTGQNHSSYDPWETTQSTTGDSTDPTNGATKPTTGGNTGATKPTTGGNTGATQPTTGGNTNTTQPTAPKDPSQVTYEDYEYYMTGDEQELFYYTFANNYDFFKWYNAAKEAYDATKDEIILDGTTPIDLGDLIGSKG